MLLGSEGCLIPSRTGGIVQGLVLVKREFVWLGVIFLRSPNSPLDFKDWVLSFSVVLDPGLRPYSYRSRHNNGLEKGSVTLTVCWDVNCYKLMIDGPKTPSNCMFINKCKRTVVVYHFWSLLPFVLLLLVPKIYFHTPYASTLTLPAGRQCPLRFLRVSVKEIKGHMLNSAVVFLTGNRGLRDEMSVRLKGVRLRTLVLQ